MCDLLVQAYQFISTNIFFIALKQCLFWLTVIGFLATAISWALGLATPIWRLGLGLRRRKIAIAADDERFSALKIDLIATNIFRETNIKQITKEHLARIKNHSLVVVHYKSFCEDELKQMLKDKESTCGMIFYYPEHDPASGDRIPNDMFQEILKRENTAVVNFRGRLLNDIINTIITTSYRKK